MKQIVYIGLLGCLLGMPPISLPMRVAADAQETPVTAGDVEGGSGNPEGFRGIRKVAIG